MRHLVLAFLATALLSSGAMGQQPSPRARAEQVLPPAAFQEVAAIAEEAAADGIPEGPIFNKALEGAAKRVPPDRIGPAIRGYAGRLREARAAFGAGASIALIVAGADALQRGVPPEALRSLPTDRPRSQMAVVVLGDLVESGVPADRALEVLREVMADRRRDDRVLDVSARVRRLIRDGVPPRDAAERVRRMMIRDRLGQPPVPPGSEPITDTRILDTR